MGFGRFGVGDGVAMAVVVFDGRPAAAVDQCGFDLYSIVGNGFSGPTIADELIELALERRFGQARTQIVLSLPKTKDDRVLVALVSLLDDPTVRAFAIEALGKMKFTGARSSIAELLDHEDKNVS
jgi:HEAT repeat protein